MVRTVFEFCRYLIVAFVHILSEAMVWAALVVGLLTLLTGPFIDFVIAPMLKRLQVWVWLLNYVYYRKEFKEWHRLKKKRVIAAEYSGIDNAANNKNREHYVDDAERWCEECQKETEQKVYCEQRNDRQLHEWNICKVCGKHTTISI